MFKARLHKYLEGWAGHGEDEPVGGEGEGEVRARPGARARVRVRARLKARVRANLPVIQAYRLKIQVPEEPFY